MNLKRSLLAIITAISVYVLIFALGQSLAEPQIQAQLELYQTNLILNVAELNQDKDVSNSDNNLNSIAQSIVGSDPYAVAQTQYEKALSATEEFLSKLQKQNKAIASETPRQQLKQNITQNQKLIDELNLKLGIITASKEQLTTASDYWQKIKDSETAEILIKLWDKSPQIANNAERVINENLDSWFKLTALKKLYKLENKPKQLINIEIKQQNLAQKALTRLLFLSFIPVVGGLIGVGLIIFLGIQALMKKENSILATNYNKTWETPWDWETILQVLVVGFFFLSQFVFPILFSIVGFNPSELNLRGKALYVLVSYLLMASGGLLVLYLSIKPFFPLPQSLPLASLETEEGNQVKVPVKQTAKHPLASPLERGTGGGYKGDLGGSKTSETTTQDWFKLTNKNWYWWGIGGYVVAIPTVFFVSLLNQQIWHGQGGSNPLLLLALKSQDTVVLIIFFVTASIAAPIFEEIIFRGFLLPSLTRYLPVSGAIIVTAIIFAIAHLSLAEAIPLATLGIILGIVYTRSRSLMASITLHSLWNSGTLISLFILGSNLD